MYEYLFEIIMIIKDIPALNDNFLITFRHQMNNRGKSFILKTLQHVQASIELKES